MTGRLWAASVGFELRQQARDPLTTLYVLVFFLLTFGYTSSDVVELVGDRGGTPRNAPWALTLAYSGLAAFGQVITTMITATAVLRDGATGALPLVATSSLSPRIWLLARAAAAALVTGVVYLAIPIGALVGAFVGEGLVPVAASRVVSWYLLPFAIVTLPTMLTVAAVLVSVGALARGVLPVLAAALVLVLLWQAGIGMAESPGTRTAGALLDPFANAPVLAMTAEWSEADRAARPVPVGGLLLANRALWLSIAGIAFGIALQRVRWREPRHAARAPRAFEQRAARRPSRSAFASVRRATTAWITGDGGWRVVSALALLNATTGAWSRAPDGATLPVLLDLVADASRLFVILLATVYAGELLWREEELRVSPLVDASPVPTRAMALARITGLGVATVQPALAIVLAGIGVALARGAVAIGDAPLAIAWATFIVWLPFAQLVALSLAVHVLVRHKVLAHLLLITGWTLAVILDRQGANDAWYRFAEPASLLTSHGAIAWGPLALRAGYWSAVSGALVAFAVARWPRGEMRGLTRSVQRLRSRATSPR